MKWISALLLLLMAAGAGAQTINPKLVFKKGQQFERTISVKSNMVMTLMGAEQQMTNDITSLSTITVREVSDSGYVLENKLTRQIITMVSMSNKQHFDSDSMQNIDDTLLGNRLMADVGKVSRIVINREGKIVTNDDTLKISEEIAGLGLLSDLANSARRPGQRYELIPVLPAGPLKTGTAWSDSVNIEGNKGLADYRLDSIKKDVAVITQSGEVSNLIEFSSGGVTTVLKTAGTAIGNFSIDPRTGILKENLITIEATGSFDVAGQSIPLTIRSVNTQSVKLKQP